MSEPIGGPGETSDVTAGDGTEIWRSEIIREFRLRAEERCAAASPGAGYPQLFSTLLNSLTDVTPGAWLDVGGGLGGVASWLERRTGHRVLGFDVSFPACLAARRLFPDLPVANSDAFALPVADGCSAVVLMSGLVSLLADPRPVLIEARRVLRRDGLVAIADLWSSTATTHSTSDNEFWSIEELRERAGEHDLGLADVGVCEAETGWWSTAIEQIDQEMEHRHGGRPEWVRRADDLRRLRRLIASGHVVAAVAIFRPGASLPWEASGLL